LLTLDERFEQEDEASRSNRLEQRTANEDRASCGRSDYKDHTRYCTGGRTYLDATRRRGCGRDDL